MSSDHQQSLDDMENWRNRARNFARSDKLGHLLMNSFELMQSVIAKGSRSKDLPLKVKALSMECAAAMAEDIKNEDDQRSLHYGVPLSLCALLESLTTGINGQGLSEDSFSRADVSRASLAGLDEADYSMLDNIDDADTVDVQSGAESESEEEWTPRVSKIASKKKRDESKSIMKQRKMGLSVRHKFKKSLKFVQQYQQGSIRTGEKFFKCDRCNKTMKSMERMRHLRNVHDLKPFKCALCDAEFERCSEYSQHKKVAHNMKCHQCDRCSKSYVSRSVLVAHMRMHTGERPFKCDECGKTFGRRGELPKHLRKDHGIAPFKCIECDAEFEKALELQDHKRTQHKKTVQIAIGENSLQCEYCEKEFPSRGALTVHIRTHTGERPFACEECGKAFISKGDHKRHARSVHGMI